MSRWSPCKRRDFIRRLRQLGFEGPYIGGQHQYMRYRRLRLALPSDSEYGVAKLKEMLREVELLMGRRIPADQWNRLK